MAQYLLPEWPAPPNVRALQTLRGGGVSPAPWHSFNLGDHVDDDPRRVAENRAILRRSLPDEPLWLKQVHGVGVVDAGNRHGVPEADAAFARAPGKVCAVMTADCLPVLFCDRAGTIVAAAHAGWRGLVAGVLEATLMKMGVPPADILCWLGPAIGPARFEVGSEVRAAFMAHDRLAAAAFVAQSQDKWLADLYTLARQRLRAAGVGSISGGGWCTVEEASRFFSFRRDRVTGRMASLIWLEKKGSMHTAGD